MHYTIEMIINKNREQVASSYLDIHDMPIWEKGLERIETIEGKLFETGSQGVMHVMFGDTSIKMKVTIEKACLPELIIQIFEVPGAWNRCVNHFIDMNPHTKWVMEVTFNFDHPVTIPQERFIEKTTQSMTMFKDYIEGKNK